jgi:arsenate reductase
MRAPIRILFLCTGNSCRSQMAEGFARDRKAGVLEPSSAGVRKHPLDPMAVRVMEEVGINISEQEPKLVDELPDLDFDYVVTLCGDAKETCPVFPAETTVFHRGFDDPPRLSLDVLDEEGKLAIYRRVRDEIRAFVENMPDNLPRPDGSS